MEDSSQSHETKDTKIININNTKSGSLKKARNQLVAADTKFIQTCKYNLTKMECKAIHYVMSLIQPNDVPGKIYKFSIKEFAALIQWKSGNKYNYIKNMLKDLADKSVWAVENRNGKEQNVLLRWINILHIDKLNESNNLGDGEIEISIHSDMFPYLYNLQQHLLEEGRPFTSYKLHYVTLMDHKYSIRLYELLKTYQYNNNKWIFENGTSTKYDIQLLLIPEDESSKNKEKIKVPATWNNWAIFRRDVIEPAVTEINKYTDMKVAYEGFKRDIHLHKTASVSTIEFYMVSKSEKEKKKTEDYIDAEYREVEDEYHQMTIEEMFFEEQKKIEIEEKKEEELKQKKTKEKEDAAKTEEYEDAVSRLAEKLNSALPELLMEKGADFAADEAKIRQLRQTALEGCSTYGIDENSIDLYVTDYIIYYFDKIAATPEDTKSTPYKRLLDCVSKDYDNVKTSYTLKYLTKM